MSSKTKFFFKLCVSFFLLYLVFSRMDWREAFSLVKGMSSVVLMVATALTVLLIFIRAAKVRIILLEEDISLSELNKITFISSFFVNLLPGGVSSEAVRAYYVFSKINSAGKSVGAILTDRITGLWTQAFFGIIALVFMLAKGNTSFSLFLTGMLFLAGCTVMSIFLFPLIIKLAERIAGFLNSNFKLKVNFEPEAAGFFYLIMKKRNRFAGILGIALIFHFIIILTVLLLDRSIGGNLSFFQAVLVLLANTVLVLLPVSISGWGISEGTFALMFHYFGADGSTGVLVSLLLRLVNLPNTLIGLVVFLNDKTTFKNIFKKSKID